MPLLTPEQLREACEELSNDTTLPSWYTSTLKTIISKNVTINDWNKLLTYVQQLAIDDRNVLSVADLLIAQIIALTEVYDSKADRDNATQTITAHEIKTDLVSPKTATSKLEIGSTDANILIRDNDENTTYVNIFSDYNTYVSGNSLLSLDSDNKVKIGVLYNTKIELTENNVNITTPTTTIGKPNKGKIQVGNDIKFIADGSTEIAKVDDEGFHVGDFVITYDTIKSEVSSFDIESANGDTKIHIDDDEVDIYTPTEDINLYDKEIEIKINGTRNQTITLAEDSGNEGSLKSEIQNDTNVSSLFEQYSYGFKMTFYEDGSEYDGVQVEFYDDGVYYDNHRLATEHQVNDEATIRFNADNDLQSQIDGLNAGQNLADIVADLTALNNLSIVNLKNGDKVQVLVDSDHDNESTVYSLSISGSSHSWHYIGMYGKSSYTKAEEDAKFALRVKYEDIVDNLTSTALNKPLSANQGRVLKGLIDDLNNAETGIQANEAVRIQNENTRIANENARVLAEQNRATEFAGWESTINGKQNALTAGTGITLSTTTLTNDTIAVDTNVIATKDYVDNSFATDQEIADMLEEVLGNAR